MDTLLDIPIGEIMADALLRDRTTLDPEALGELLASVLRDGLRQPIEVWELGDPADGFRYGLISGQRRLSVFRTLGVERGDPRFATIPAFLRKPADRPAAMAAMVAENEIRAEVSPWEKGCLIVEARYHELFDTLDAAVDGLYPDLTRQKRARLRGFAMVVEELDGAFSMPERLTVARMDRLAAALRGGLAELVHAALDDCRGAGLETQWSALAPVFAEAMAEPDGYAPSGPGRPRRLLRLRQGLIIRREYSRTGWILRFTGPEAKSGGLIDDVMDEVERWFQKR